MMPNKEEKEDIKLPYVLEYPEHDKNIGAYKQVIRFETLDAVINYIKILKEKGK